MVSALETALYIARGLEENSREGRRNGGNISWNATPERRFLKCVLGVLIRKRLPKSDLLAKFKELVPDYQIFFDIPVSDSSIWGRADTGRRGGKYRGENPDISPITKPFWPLAQMAVEDDRPLTAADVRKLVSDNNEEPEPAAAE